MKDFNKKSALFLFLGLIISFYTGCSSKRVPVIEPTLPPRSEPTVCIPEWVKNPPAAQDGIYDSGQARKKIPALSEMTADHRARVKVAMSVRAKIEAMLRDFMQESGIGVESDPLAFSESVSQSFANEELHGLRITKRHICPDGTYHSLAFWPYKEAGSVKRKVIKAIRRKESLYNEFKARQGFEKLRKELDRLFDGEE